MHTPTESKSIDLALLASPVINSRNISEVIRSEINDSFASSFSISFLNVEFISRSAAHALVMLKMQLGDAKELNFVDMPTNIRRTFNAVNLTITRNSSSKSLVDLPVVRVSAYDKFFG